MASTFTTILELEKPAVGEQTDTWNVQYDSNMDTIDALFENDAAPRLKVSAGGTGANDAAGARTALGLGSADSVTFASVNVTAGTLLLPATNTPAQTADGSVVWDSDSDLLTVGTGAARKTMADTDSTQTLTNKTISGGSHTVTNLSTGSGATLGTDGPASASVDLFGSPGAGGTGSGCVGIAGGGSPNTDPLYSFGQIYVHADGSLRYRSPNGTTTTIGAA